MPNDKDQKDRKYPSEKKEDRKEPTPRPQNKEALSTEDLDQVAGGINPQPLPPGRNRAGQ